MRFNSSKCKVLHFGANNKEFSYFMGTHMLNVVNEKKNVGVCITSDFKSARQCQLAYSKANKVLELIAGTILYKDTDVLIKLYKTLFHPHLEYCVFAWWPHYAKDKSLLI